MNENNRMVKRNEANEDESVENERNVVNEIHKNHIVDIYFKSGALINKSFENLASLRIYEYIFDHVERSKTYVVQLARFCTT
ncbi:hypothetical protein H8356DRAFT_1341709 [Neocallimastix lanati (nom. inval.)]|nr:hypothetical protein H8356DRAFT_1341709 [Neocallimastix sp. JGI-2020a]